MKSLVVLAAGMGTRFNGLKQLAPVGHDGEAIVDFLLRRADAAGFDGAVVVVRPDIVRDIDDHFDAHDPPLPTTLAVQSEPLGTAHAVLACAELIDSAFAVVNADDLYPSNAFAMLAKHLADSHQHALVGFRVDRTLVSGRPVSRARIETTDDHLDAIVEETVSASTAGTHWVSMNMWGFQPSALDHMERAVATRAQRREVLLPDVVAAMVDAGEHVRVLRCNDPCIGITYADDVDLVRARLR